MASPSASACLGDLTKERERLLAAGHAADLELDTAERYLAQLPDDRFASVAYRRDHDRPYIQPRGGFPTFAKQLALTQAFQHSAADFIPLTIDSVTRHNDYERATTLLDLGTASNRDLLNGYPLVSHGFLRTRELYSEIGRPVSLRHGTPDARLLTELALAAGLTEIEGGGISYTLPYAKEFPLDRALLGWQYVDRLAATSGPPGRPVHRESFGPLTATLVPPVVTVVVQLCELLLAAEQGVESFAVGFGQSGSLEQDLATATVLRNESRAVLDRFGFDGVTVSLVFHQWMGAFPADRGLAWALIAASAMMARLVGADKVVTKTAEEAAGVPTIESNVAAVGAVGYVLDMLPGVAPLSNDGVEAEVDLITAEVREVMEHLFADPAPTWSHSVQRGVLAGTIDVPFAPHRENQNRLVTERDAARRIRILDPGGVPLSPESLRRERRELELRPPPEGPLWERLLQDVRILA